MVRMAAIMFTIILVISVYCLVKNIAEYNESKQSSIELAEEVAIEESNEEEKIDWDKLEKINKDIIGWIKIDNTNINYPILRDDKQLKYLRHSFNGEYNRNGSIFTLNSNAFEDNITTLYGHNMKNKIMFSELSNYMNEDFFYNNINFKIYTRKQNYEATIFSCYSIAIRTEENNIKQLSFNDEIEYYKKSSKFENNDIGEIKNIVKLSTCSYLNNHSIPTNQRYYIIAKLEKCN